MRSIGSSSWLSVELRAESLHIPYGPMWRDENNQRLIAVGLMVTGEHSDKMAVFERRVRLEG